MDEVSMFVVLSGVVLIGFIGWLSISQKSKTKPPKNPTPPKKKRK